MILLCVRLRWSPQRDLSLDVAPPDLRCSLSVTLPALCEQRLPHFPRVFRARQHCHKVESKVDGGSRSLAGDDAAEVHHPLINTVRARNFDAGIARRRRPPIIPATPSTCRAAQIAPTYLPASNASLAYRERNAGLLTGRCEREAVVSD